MLMKPMIAALLQHDPTLLASIFFMGMYIFILIAICLIELGFYITKTVKRKKDGL